MTFVSSLHWGLFLSNDAFRLSTLDCIIHHVGCQNTGPWWLWLAAGISPAFRRWLTELNEALWHLICASSCCLRGPVRLPVLMHCSITKISVCRVREERRGRGRGRPPTAENMAEKRLLQRPEPHVTWQRGWMSKPHSAERQTGRMWD